MGIRLRYEVHFFKGASKGCLVDSKSGEVYSINEDGCQVLLGSRKYPAYEKKLVSMGLVIRSKQKTKIKQTRIPPPLRKEKLRFVWFEIVSDLCNEKCLHCYASASPRRKKDVRRLTCSDWKRLIREAFKAGCDTAQFIGGEPFLYRGEKRETVLDLARYARKKVGYKFIEIFTNGTLLDEEKVKQIKELGLHIAISIYSTDPKIHDKITQTPGSYQKTFNTLQLLKKYNISTRISYILMKQNEGSIQKTLKDLKKMGFYAKPDPLRPCGRGTEQKLDPSLKMQKNYGLMLEPNFYAWPEYLNLNGNANTCLLGKITIKDNGDVVPCIFARDHIFGNVTQKSLKKILKSATTQETWGLSKDRVVVCKDCEYRYVCHDCRPLAESNALNRVDWHDAPPGRCTYNPYTGEWGKGSWKVDQKGKAYYQKFSY